MILSAQTRRTRNSTACDSCRRKKIKCDNSQYPGSRCFNCIDFDIECTYCQPTKKRGPKSKYVETLEAKVKALMRQAKKSDARSSKASSFALSQTSSVTEDSLVDQQDLDHVEFMDQLKNLSINPVKERFFGPDSYLLIFKNVMSSGGPPPQPPPMQQGHRRPQYWNEPPWEWQTESSERWIAYYIFPDCDLIDTLLAIYFSRIHIHYPIIHQPTFLQAVSDGIHFENRQFGAVLLLVCAVAAPYSDDPRVLADTGPFAELSCGWQWYEQVQGIRKNLFQSATLYELQMYSLSALYLISSSAPHAALYVVSIAMRFSEDLGLHRRKPDGYKMTAEDELMRRNFWSILCFERILCTFLGRSHLLRDSEIDADMPVESDDQYWKIPSGRDQPVEFAEPNDTTPSLVVAFNRQIALCRLLSKTKKIFKTNVEDQRSQEALAKINMGLNEWLDSVPEHLRWPDLPGSSSVYFAQSATIYSIFYMIQIQAHRHFIQTSSPLSANSIATCANAAKACSHILESQAKLADRTVLLHTIITTFAAAAILIVIKRTGHESDMESVERCLSVLKSYESRWSGAGRLWDMLRLMLLQEQKQTVPMPNDLSLSLPPPAMPRHQLSPLYPVQSTQSITPDHSLYGMLAFYNQG